jgi:hypothetical protein
MPSFFARRSVANGELPDDPWVSADFLARFILADMVISAGRRLSSRSAKSEDSLHLSLFTRLQAVETELRAMKELLAELKVNQDALRRDRDEWRWRAERLLTEQERGAFWRWRKRTDAALDIVAASLSRLAADLGARLAEVRLSRDALGHRSNAWRLGRVDQPSADGREMEGR